jgi:transporter family protein
MRAVLYNAAMRDHRWLQAIFRQRWLLFALLSAASASFVGIFGKLGMKEIDSNLATAVRSVVMTLFLVGVCTAFGAWSKVGTLHGKAILMIVLSGVAGAVSWLFYFRAIQIGTVSQVAPIDKLSMPFAVILAVLILRDRPSDINWLGVLLIVAGGYLASLPAGR